MLAGVRLCSVLLVVMVALFAAPQTAIADDVSDVVVPIDSFDVIGDSPDAPDIGQANHSVILADPYRKVVIGVWLNRSDLAQGEQVNVYFNWRGGGEQYFGGDYLFSWYGRTPPATDTYAAWAWDNGWVATTAGSPSAIAYPDGRIYFYVNFLPGGPVGLRVSSTRAGGSVIDYAPDAAKGNLFVSLEKHGLPNPLEGCTYNPQGCVGPASGVGAQGPGPNTGNSGGNSGGPVSAACVQARHKLAAVRQRLARAKRALSHASTRAAKRRQRSRVKRLRRTRSKWKRAVAAKC